MRRLLAGAMVMAVLLPAVANLPAQETQRQRLGVMPFGESGSRIQGTGQAAADKITEVLVKGCRFDMVDRQSLDKVMAEQKLSMTGMVSDASAVQVGNLLGMKYIIIGNVVDASAKKEKKFSYSKNQPPAPYWEISCTAVVTLRVIDVETSQILFAGQERRATTSREEYREDKQESGSALEKAAAKIALRAAGVGDEQAEDLNVKYQSQIMQALRNATYLFRDDISNIFPLTGYVIQVDGPDSVTIDLGKKNGMKKGSKLFLVRQGAPFKHPVTGKMLPGKKVRLGEVEVSQEPDDEMSTVKIKDKALKGQVKVGDTVEAKPEKVGIWEQMGNK